MSLNISEPALLRNQASIDGQWVNADDNDTLPIFNPASGELITEVAKVGAAETERAILAAERALQD